MAEKRGLGRGLSALMADVGLDRTRDSDASADKPKAPDRFVPIEKIHPNQTQPRRDFDPDALRELADSIRARGIIQPLVLRPLPGTPGEYEIVAGERRWRASQIAQIHEVPAVIRELTDAQVFELALIENIQRRDLNAYEEATAYQRLQEEFGHTQEDISAIVGKSRSHVANLMRLLNLPDDVLRYLRSGELTAGHAKAILPSPNRSEHARTIVAHGLSVRQAEELVAREGSATEKPARPADEASADSRELSQELSAHLKLKVVVKDKGDGKGGTVSISYTSLDEFERLLDQLGIAT